jgi:hypothetical protein
MIKPFILTLIFTVLFTIMNSIGDAINFYKNFICHKDMKLWHMLKFGWMGCAVGVGWFLNETLRAMEYDVFPSTVVVLFFCLMRWILHETLMWKWRQP